MQGYVFGNYRVTAQIGMGGMGVVYRGEHTMLGKQVAIKVLQPNLAQDRKAVTRFFNEAKAASGIKNKGIVEIHDFGYAHDCPYIIMEYLEGESLDARMQRLQHIPIPQALRLMGQLARSLAAAHQERIIHRDLKPENIIIVKDGEVAGGERTKLLDFGIAKLSTQEGVASMTQTGAIMGTPTYMAPEQCQGAGQVDHRADLYSFGCILFHMLCGRPPFASTAPFMVMGEHVNKPPPSPRVIQPTLSADLDAFILRLLAKQPAQRVQSADEAVDTIEQLLQQVSPARRPRPSRPLPDAADAATMPMKRMLPAQTTLSSSAGAMPVTGTPTPAPRRQSWLVVLLAAAFSLALLGTGLALWLQRQEQQSASRPAPAEAPDTTAPTTPIAADGGVQDESPDDHDDHGESSDSQDEMPEIQIDIPESESKSGPSRRVKKSSRRVKQPQKHHSDRPKPAEKTPASKDDEPESLYVIRSQPSGAAVYMGRRKLGETPHELWLPTKGRHRLKLRLTGYEQATVTVPNDDDDDDGTLTIAMSRRPARKARTPATPPTSGAAATEQPGAQAKSQPEDPLDSSSTGKMQTDKASVAAEAGWDDEP